MPKIDTDLWRWYHNVSECHYHIQITIKFRKAVLEPHVIETILETLKGFKERFAIHIYKIGFDQNHVHILCQFLPTHSGGDVIGLIKKLTARPCLRIPSVKEQLWGGSFWTDGYYIGTVSNRGSKETIERYIEKQGRKPQEVQLKLFDLE